MRAVALLGALALLAAGCGGGGEAPAVDPAAATPGTDPNAAVVGNGAVDPSATGVGTTPGTDAGSDEPGVNEIGGASAAVGSPVKVSAITPKKFKAAHCSKPIIVVFYQPGAVVDEALLDEARAATASVKGAGVVSLVYTPKDNKAFGDLPAKLGLLTTPGVATVSRAGEIENFWTTFVDRALIERSLRNAAAAKPCKVGGEDVPAAGSALSDAALVANGGTITPGTTAAATGQEPGTPAVDAAGAGTTGAIDPAAAGATAADPTALAPTA